MEHRIWTTFGWPLVFFVLVYVVYLLWVGPWMAETARVLGKPRALAASSGFAWLQLWVSGWKTHILALIAGLSQAIALAPQMMNADLIREWQALPWAQAFDASTANKISLVCAVLIPITHSIGLLNAAKTPPQV